MSKFKLFIDNFLIYGFGGIISKLIPFVMLPVITRLMPNTEYFGISEMVSTLSSFGSAIAIMGMYDAMYRMYFEKEDLTYQKKVCSTTLTFTICTSLIVCFVILFCKDRIALLFFKNTQYSYILYLSAIAVLVSGTNHIVAGPTRMQNQRKIFLITNAIAPLISYTVAIILLMKGYFIIALPLASVVSGITIEILFVILNHNWFKIGKFDKTLLKEMLVIAIPLLPNFLIYWLFNSCDKLMVTNLIGIGAAGVYSVGAKLGHASQLIYVAFAGGWQYFAFSTMKDKEQVRSNSSVFEYLGVVSYVATAFICAWSYVLFHILFPERYLSGFIIAPYLFLAPLLLMLFQVAATQFVIIKKTWPNMLILSVGAFFNVVLNKILIPLLGIEGAAIATLSGYLVAVAILVIVLLKLNLIVVNNRFLLITFSLIIYFLIWRLFVSTHFLLANIMAILFTVLCIYFYKKELMFLLRKIKKCEI